MTLPLSPPINMQQVATELGTTLPISLTDNSVRTLAGIPTGNISLLDLLGKSAAVVSGNMVNGQGVAQLPNQFWGFSAGNFGAFTGTGLVELITVRIISPASFGSTLTSANSGLAGLAVTVSIGASSQSASLTFASSSSGLTTYRCNPTLTIFFNTSVGLVYSVAVH